MAETKIEWADYTFNPWLGCTKVSPACDHCYAESWAKRAGDPQLWQGARRRTTIEYWQQPFRWNDKAKADGARQRVFCASLADVFDNVIDPQWRSDLFQLIERTPHLDWLLLTKRIGNVAKLCGGVSAWPNVWLGATVANQEEADRDIPKLLRTRARVRFLSCEPLLGPIDLVKAGAVWSDMNDQIVHRSRAPRGRYGHLDWVIVGGESGGKSRPMSLAWARGLRDQCQLAGVAFLFKQWGEWAPFDALPDLEGRGRFDTMLDGGIMVRAGKKLAGRMLDGRTWDQFPEVA